MSLESRWYYGGRNCKISQCISRRIYFWSWNCLEICRPWVALWPARWIQRQVGQSATHSGVVPWLSRWLYPWSECRTHHQEHRERCSETFGPNNRWSSYAPAVPAMVQAPINCCWRWWTCASTSYGTGLSYSWCWTYNHLGNLSTYRQWWWGLLL